jgi:leader peptidase (prepilin peptidase)/N-methyltransferase
MEEVFLILLGLIVGSFLNVVIHRLPLEQSIVHPRSHCPFCRQIIRFYDNIPVLSYIVLGGRCRHCKSEISVRYPLVEMFTAFSFWLSYQFYGHLPLYTAFTAGFLSILIALALIDLQHMILPDELTIGGAVVFLGYSFFNPAVGFVEAFGSAIGAALFFAAVYYFYLRVRKIEGLGHGDIKMMLLLGAFLGVQKLIVGVLLASFSGVVVGLFFIIFRRQNLRLALPYGTFLAAGSYIAVFWGDQILIAIQSLY